MTRPDPASAGGGRLAIVAILLLRGLAIGLIGLMAAALVQLHADDSPANVFARPAMTIMMAAFTGLAAVLFALAPALVRALVRLAGQRG